MEIFDPAAAGTPESIPHILPEHKRYAITGADAVTTMFNWCVAIRQSLVYDRFRLIYDVFIVERAGKLYVDSRRPVFLLCFVLGDNFNAFQGTEVKMELKHGQCQLLFIPAGQIETTLPVGEFRVIQLEMGEAFLQQFLNTPDGKDTHAPKTKPISMAGIPIGLSAKTQLLVDKILCNELEGVQASMSIELAAKELLLISLQDIQEQANKSISGGFKDLRRFEDIRAYILSDLANASSERICERFKISRTRLYLGFARIYRVTLREYILQQKMEMAKLMLREGTLVSEIAKKVGYLDSSNFIRAFKNVTGVTPTQYRDAVNDTK